MWHEVLANGDPDVVDVLLAVSVVDRVNMTLAAAITGRPDAGELLARGEAQGLFVFRLGTEGWFRIHPLVRERVRSELVRSGRASSAPRTGGALVRGRRRDRRRARSVDRWPDGTVRRFGSLAARSTELYDQGREASSPARSRRSPGRSRRPTFPRLIDFAVSHILGPRDRFVETVRDVIWHADRDEQRPLGARRCVAGDLPDDVGRLDGRPRRSRAERSPRWATPGGSDPAGRFAWNTAARGIALVGALGRRRPFVRDATIAMSRDPRARHLAGGHPGARACARRDDRSTPCVSLLASVQPRRRCRSCASSWRWPRRSRSSSSPSASERGPRCTRSPTAGRTPAVRAGRRDAGPRRRGDRRGRCDGCGTRARPGRRARHGRRRRSGPAGLGQRRATTVAILRGDVGEARRRASAVTDPFWGPVSQAQGRARGGRSDGCGRRADGAPCRGAHATTWSARSSTARAATAPDEVAEHAARAAELASEHGMLRTVVADGRELVHGVRAGRVAGAGRMAAPPPPGDGPAAAGRPAPDPRPAGTPHRSRARRAAAAAEPADDRRDRQGAVRVGEHGEVPPARRSIASSG